MRFPIILVLLTLTTLISNAALIKHEKSKFTVQSTITGKQVKQNIYYCGPRHIKSDTRVVIIMHGNKRNAKDYRDAWENHTGEGNLLILVPEFSKQDFPRSNSYNLAGMVSPSGILTPSEYWTFPLIDNLFLTVKKDQKLESERFYLYGHSAGAQFVHRYAMFANSSRLGLAIAANAG